MAMIRNKVFIVGCGPGGPDYVPPAARAAVAKARAIAGAERLLRLFPESTAHRIPLPPAVAPAIETIAERVQAGSVAVLVSGDPGLFSLAKAIVQHFGRETCEIIPAVSSLQVAFARLGLDWSDARILSAHGRIPEVTADELSRSRKIAIFVGGRDTADWVCRTTEELAITHRLFVFENLTLAEETVREMRAEELRQAEFASLTLLVLVQRGEYPDDQRRSDSTGA